MQSVLRNDSFSAVGYEVFHAREIYELERERIFNGPTWNYLCLEVELSEPGAFLTTYVGDVPVLVNRAEDGTIEAFENRCMHRGTRLRREARGVDRNHICAYHQWCYSLKGELVSVPFARGVKGKGGLPKDFDKSAITLRRMEVANTNGVIWGTFSADREPIEEYLGETVLATIGDMFFKPVKILGYQRQRILGNWKLYNENLRDPNHGGLLHMFHATFGLARLSQSGGARMDAKHRHNISYATMGTDDAESTGEGYKDTKKVYQDGFQLRDKSMLRFVPELPNPESLVILSVFPNVVFQQISNSLCTRQIRLRGVDEFELYWMYYGFEDDTPEMADHRRVQANLVGPGGLVSMEDGEAVQLVHEQTRSSPPNAASRIVVGGTGEITDQETLVTEVPIRGFWSHYFDLMQV